MFVIDEFVIILVAKFFLVNFGAELNQFLFHFWRILRFRDLEGREISFIFMIQVQVTRFIQIL